MASSATYLDASALVKLVVEEPESDACRAGVAGYRLVTSDVALVELTRASRIADPSGAALAAARRLLDETQLVNVSRRLLDRAAELASMEIRTLDAIHLATALDVQPDVFVAYDRRLLDAAERHGLSVVSPGASI